MNKPKIYNPCPMVFSRMSKLGPNLSCPSCQKEIIDFRGKSDLEVQCLITSKTCGVFDSHQLVEEKDRSYYYKTIFLALTVLSFLGFNVTPINAQITNKIDTVMVDSSNVTLNNSPPSRNDNLATNDKKKIKRKRRRLFRRKKKKYRIIGTPRF